VAGVTVLPTLQMLTLLVLVLLLLLLLHLGLSTYNAAAADLRPHLAAPSHLLKLLLPLLPQLLLLLLLLVLSVQYAPHHPATASPWCI
jgi:hypothetical protein